MHVVLRAGAPDSPFSQKKEREMNRGGGEKWVKQKEGRAGMRFGKGWARGSGSD